MAPNIIGNTFMLAETTIEQEHQKNNNNSAQCPNSNILQSSSTTTTDNQQKLTKKSLEIQNTTKPYEYKLEIVWRNVIAFILLHMWATYGLWLILTEGVLKEYIWGHLVGMCGGIGITAGAHRLWAHRSYKAKWPLRVILMIFQTIAFQNSIYEWVRDHRVHHKYTDTNADPHNSKRGFFFSHMGWLMCKKHPDVKGKGKCIDMSDLEADPIVRFQKRHYMILMPLCCFVLPAVIPYFYFGVSMKICFFVCSILRYVLSLHFTWLVNSAAHIWGMRPYDKYIRPTNNKTVAILAYGEGWHNYHHVFPWDYKTSELGEYSTNFTKAFIDFFAKIGWAYDLKTVPNDMIKKRVKRTGDGSHKYSQQDQQNIDKNELIKDLNELCNHDDQETHIWGWDDKDMLDDERNEACIINKKD